MPPIYTFECATHGGFEVVRSIKDYNKPTKCPKCKKKAKKTVETKFPVHPSWRTN